MRRIVLTAVMAALTVTHGAAAQTPRAWSTLLQEWVTAIRDHRPGDEDGDVRRVSAWSSQETEILFPYLDALLQLLWVPDRPRLQKPLRRFSQDDMRLLRQLAKLAVRDIDVNTVLKRAALLHTDVALFGLVNPEPIAASPWDRTRDLAPRSTAGRQVVIRLLDGQFVGLELGSFHWYLARRILDAVDPAPDRDETVRFWYRAVAATLAESYNFADLTPHLERAQTLFPSDAHILYAAACLEEVLAAPRVQHEVEAMVLPRGVTIRGVFSTAHHLQRADTLFQQVFTIDRSLFEAQVRLARVRGLSGHHNEAAIELRQIIPQLQDDIVTYYGLMFLGQMEEELGRPDDAVEAYTRAATLFRRAQSPHIAISRVARRAGDRAGALRSLQIALTMPLERRDPWWEYFSGPGRHAETLLEAVREPFRQP
jgi:tetratricopeptide (TPR) repeat protein